MYLFHYILIVSFQHVQVWKSLAEWLVEYAMKLAMETYAQYGS